METNSIDRHHINCVLQPRKALYLFITISLILFACNAHAQYYQPYPWAKAKIIAGIEIGFTGYLMGGQYVVRQADKIIPGAYLGFGTGIFISGIWDAIRNRKVRVISWSGISEAQHMR